MEVGTLALAMTTLAGQPPHVPQLFGFASPRQTYNEGVSKRESFDALVGLFMEKS